MSKRTVILYLSVIIFLAFTLFPLVWTFITSVSPLSELMAMPKHWIPSDPTLQNYNAIFTGSPLPGAFIYSTRAPVRFHAGLMNSLIVTLSTIAIALPIVVLAGFAFSRLRFPFKKYFFVGVFAVIVLPHLALLPALYDMFTNFGLLDTKLALIIFNLSWSVPLGIWLMTSYFSTIPDDLIKAGRVDGCSWRNVLFKVVLRPAVPGIIAVTIIEFVVVWNEFIGALVFTETMASKTFPVVLAEFIGLAHIDYGGMAAAAIIAIFPAIIFALAFQKYIVKGLTMGAVKE